MWVALALLCALFIGTGDVLSKFALRKSDEGIVGLGRLLFSIPILAGVAMVKEFPTFPPSFWRIFLFLIPFELAAYLLYLRAIRVAPLSLAVPFLTFTPVFTIVTCWVLLGERVSRTGALGIVIITAGAYLLYLETAEEGWFSPIRAIFRERGSRYMVTAAFLYSITSNLGKRAIQLSDPYAFAFFYQLSDSVILWLVMWRVFGRRSIGREVLSQWRIYILLGSVMACAFLVHCIGIVQAPVPYFLAIKRTSLLIGVLYGGLLLKEERLAQRLTAAVLMVLGVGLIAFLG